MSETTTLGGWTAGRQGADTGARAKRAGHRQSKTGSTRGKQYREETPKRTPWSGGNRPGNGEQTADREGTAYRGLEGAATSTVRATDRRRKASRKRAEEGESSRWGDQNRIFVALQGGRKAD